MRGLFPNGVEFLSRVKEEGCIVESRIPVEECIGSIQLQFFIEPDGSINQVAALQRVTMIDFITCGVSFPQRLLPSLNSEKLAQQLGERIHGDNVWGHIQVDLLVSSPPPTSHSFTSSRLFET